MRIRTYGSSGATVVVVHGGPGAPGSAAPIARGLAGSFRVLEPDQRGSGAERLTVARHVADLQAVIEGVEGGPPAVVGHSWGAMLALAHASAHPNAVAAIVLVACGTFDPASRARLDAVRESRIDPALRARLDRLSEDVPDPDARLAATARLLLPVYACDPVEDDPEVACDARAFHESWGDMLRLQREGVYPAAFASIAVPVLMLHGAYDPHPGRAILASLTPFMPQIEYREWERCGHYPWIERGVREEFFHELRLWLSRWSAARAAGPAVRDRGLL